MRFFSLLAIASLSLSLITACKNEPSGVETEHGYRVVNHTNKEGVKPKTGDLVKVHVALSVGDTMLQDTRKISPDPREVAIPDFSQIPAGRKVPAIFDGVLLAAVGDSITIYQPMDSAFALQLPARLKKEKYMRFDLVLYEVTTAEDMKKQQEGAIARFEEIQKTVTATVADYKAGKLNDKITTLPSGLKIMIEDKGNGGPMQPGTQVKTHYYGSLIDGKMFDNSFQRGEPLPFMLGAGQMIPGFDEGAQQINHGGKAYFFIPSKLGYGDKTQEGSPIPPNSELIFYVEAL